jgi:IS30 family transposase
MSIHELTAHRLERVTRLTAAGWSAAEIAEDLGVTPRSVTRLRAKAGLTNGVQIPRWTPQQVELFDRLLTEGWSYREISRTHHVNEGTLSRRFPGRGWKTEQKIEIREARRLLAAIPSRTLRETSPAVEERFTGHRRARKTSEVRRWIRTGAPAAPQMAR